MPYTTVEAYITGQKYFSRLIIQATSDAVVPVTADEFVSLSKNLTTSPIRPKMTLQSRPSRSREPSRHHHLRSHMVSRCRCLYRTFRRRRRYYEYHARLRHRAHEGNWSAQISRRDRPRYSLAIFTRSNFTDINRWRHRNNSRFRLGLRHRVSTFNISRYSIGNSSSRGPAQFSALPSRLSLVSSSVVIPPPSFQKISD